MVEASRAGFKRGLDHDNAETARAPISWAGAKRARRLGIKIEERTGYNQV